jgi:hypothetical protein
LSNSHIQTTSRRTGNRAKAKKLRKTTRVISILGTTILKALQAGTIQICPLIIELGAHPRTYLYLRETSREITKSEMLQHILGIAVSGSRIPNSWQSRQRKRDIHMRHASWLYR